MRMPIIFVYIIILFLLKLDFSQATELYEINTSVRALGMGNAYVGVVQNADALFYNPAGLSRVSGINWLIMDPKIGLNGAQVLSTVSDIQSSSSFEQTVQNLYGDHVWAGGGAKSALTLPNLGFAIYDHADASFDVNNPVYPNLDVSIVNDYGYALGASLPLLPVFHIGTTIKYIQRTGSRKPFGPSYISNLDPSTITDNAQNKGTGYSFDLGMNLLIPGPISPVFSLVWKDVGNTTFRPTSLGLETPPTQQSEMIVGMALNIDTPIVSVAPAFDFKYLDRSGVQLGRKIHLGVEIGIPLIDIRAGFSEGYYTLGAGFNLGLIRIDAATYGVELGDYPGQREDRRYILQASLELGFGPLASILGLKNSSSSSDRQGKGSGGSSGSSFRRHLKQRR
ncbi:MAG: hypothetical protein K1X29_09640 [Bdellovibrionales bacterium]|nr:hypothetical protein [Bdellovibrionales bacterium]